MNVYCKLNAKFDQPWLIQEILVLPDHQVRPAEIMPHWIHKCLEADQLEEAEQVGLELCIECGLCSYVCPSKIDLRSQLIEGKQRLAEEKA